MEGSQDISASAAFTFRGSDYIVSLESRSNKMMNVQVEDRETGDQWQASFEPQYLEDLTHKTGNFKQFNIFANMLESAISKASESVTLDLLTYADLESLRQKKSGASHSVKTSTAASRSSHLTSKRYLILTYTVEFDRIHYPLPLPYVGKSDPMVLQKEVFSLRAEVQRLKEISLGDGRGEKLMREIHKLEKAKAEIEQEYALFRREVKVTTGGNAAKDIRALKLAVRNLEDQLMKEKTRHQRSTNKRSQEYRELLDEVEELRASERNLRVRLKSLTNELALYKRGRTTTRTNSKDRPGSGDRMSATRNPLSSRQRSASSERLHTGRSGSGSRLHGSRSGSRDRQPFLPRSNSAERISHGSFNGAGSTRARSNSYDRASANRSGMSSGSGRNRSRTPSPAVARRFNPTAYIKEKERRNRESSLKIKREQRTNVSGTSIKSRTSANSSRNSAYSNRQHSRENSVSSFNGNMSDGYNSDGSYTSHQRSTGVRKWSGDANASKRQTRPPPGRSSKQLASTPDMTQPKSKARTRQFVSSEVGDDGDSDCFDRSAEISEIDERLDRLQQLMKATMP